MWRVGGRFGPLESEPPHGRRSLREHLDAAGTFLWRRRAGGAMLTAVRQRLREQLARRHPELARLSPKDAIPRLRDLSGIDQGRLEVALIHEDVPDARRFTQAVKDLQMLARML